MLQGKGHLFIGERSFPGTYRLELVGTITSRDALHGTFKPESLGGMPAEFGRARLQLADMRMLVVHWGRRDGRAFEIAVAG